MNTGDYENPLCTRYAGSAMRRIFSDDYKFATWRRLWIALAESERELGLPIAESQIGQLRAHVTDIDYEAAARYESALRHDVMAHIRTYGDACPEAAGILHLGATSSYVGDNTSLLQMRDALNLVRAELLGVIAGLAAFAERYKDLPCLAYTHFQPAQPTTVGKRATLWLFELLMDLEALDKELTGLRFFGCKGTTGTGASFLALFEGDAEKVTELELRIARKMGFDAVYPVAGQTYSRKIDYNILSVLCGIAQSASKFATDIRLLSHLQEVAEPFGKKQVGSSAMAYKRNPMRSERICSLGRLVITQTSSPALTAASQWLERTLDDSANRRIVLPEAFLATDAILALYRNVIEGLSVYPRVMERHLREELPFLATENILMYCTKKGGDRQALHEALRRHSVAASQRVKEEGADNDLFARILADPVFGLSDEELDAICDVSRFIGCAPLQTENFLRETVRPILEANAGQSAAVVEITV